MTQYRSTLHEEQIRAVKARLRSIENRSPPPYSSTSSSSSSTSFSSFHRFDNPPFDSKYYTAATMPSEKDLRIRFSFPIFLLTQFNVHYMSWIKNTAHFSDYMDRFSCVYDKIMQLPEFCANHRHHNRNSVQNETKDWIIQESISESFRYRRQLVIGFNHLTGIRSAKKIRISFQFEQDSAATAQAPPQDANKMAEVDEMNEKQECNVDSFMHVVSDGSDEMSGEDGDRQANQDPDETVDDPEFVTSSSLMTEDEGDSIVRNSKRGSGSGSFAWSSPKEDSPSSSSSSRFSHFTKRKATITDDVTKCAQATKNEIENNSNNANEKMNCVMKPYEVSGDIDLVSGVTYVVQFPEINYIPRDIYIKLALIDSADPTGREYIKLFISEAIISGYTGYRRRFHLKLNEAPQNEYETEIIEFELSLSWQIDSTCFDANRIADPCEIIRKLPGALFLLGGEYYWHFYKQFYRKSAMITATTAAATKPNGDDDNEWNASLVRKAAMESFAEICLMLPPSILKTDMIDIFYEMYPIGSPLIDPIDPILLLDNSMPVIYYMAPERQIEIVQSLLAIDSSSSTSTSISALLATRFRSIRRLISLLDHYLSNYADDSLERVIGPFALQILHYLMIAKVGNDGAGDDYESAPFTNDVTIEIGDERDASTGVRVEAIDCVIGQAANLLIGAIQRSRPQEWASLPLEHERMRSTAAILQRTIETLFTRHSIALLKAIYCRLRERRMLQDRHLAPFLTAPRIKRYRSWFG